MIKGVWEAAVTTFVALMMMGDLLECGLGLEPRRPRPLTDISILEKFPDTRQGIANASAS